MEPLIEAALTALIEVVTKAIVAPAEDRAKIITDGLVTHASALDALHAFMSNSSGVLAKSDARITELEALSKKALDDAAAANASAMSIAAEHAALIVKHDELIAKLAQVSNTASTT